jgi:hypothetical protein
MSLNKTVPYDRLVKPIHDAELRAILATLPPSQWAVMDDKYSAEERHDRILRFRQHCVDFAAPYFPDLGEMPHCYVLNGNTDYINQVFARATTMGYFEGDYRYYRTVAKSMNRETVSTTISSSPIQAGKMEAPKTWSARRLQIPHANI